MNISACLVTRGDVDMRPILDSLPDDWEVVVWDNSVEEDAGVYGRYLVINRAKGDVIFVQDDDCVLGPGVFAKLKRAYKPGVLVANMPAEFRAGYPDSCLVGLGALFDREMPTRVLTRCYTACPDVSDDDIRLRCDVIFTALTPRVLVDAPVTILPYAYGADRMFQQPDHFAERMRVLEMARQCREPACV